MRRKFLIHILFLTLPIYFGCTSLQPISKSSWSSIKNEENNYDEIEVNTKNGMKYIFEITKIEIASDSLYGEGLKKVDAWHEYYFKGSIPLSEITSFRTSQFDLTVTLILFGGIAIIILLFMLISAEGYGDMGFSWR